MGRRGSIRFRGPEMRSAYQTDFIVTQVHQDHVQIIDEHKKAKWDALTQSAAYQSNCEQLRDAIECAQVAFDECVQVCERSACPKSKAMLRRVYKKLHSAQVVLRHIETPNYYEDVPYDSIFSFEFAFYDGLRIVF